MVYVPQQWQSGNTAVPYGPINGARLQHIEDGIDALANQPVYRTATVALSSAQILALTTPVTLVAAAGAGKRILPMWVHFVMTAGSTPYSSGGVLNFRYTPSNSALGDFSFVTAFNTLLGAAASTKKTMPLNMLAYIGEFVDPAANSDNQALAMSLSANPTAGNGTLTVSVWYVLASL